MDARYMRLSGLVDIEFTGTARPIIRDADGIRWKVSLDGPRITTEEIV